jgi:hypothetical protein
MPSTYTTDLKIQLMVTGENAGTWGQITNTNLVLIEQAIAGYESISIAGGAQTTALVLSQNALSTARNIVIKLTGTITGNQIVTVPNTMEKTWIVSNATTGAFTVQFKYASTGTGITWSATDKLIKILYADGTDIQTVDLNTLSGTISAAQITQSTITQSKLAANSVGANQIIQSTITQSKLAANSVGSNQLISTGVTAASYTATTITVDADGRITSASSGAGAGGMGIPTLYAVGPTSGTYTAGGNTNVILAYAYGGGPAGGYGAWKVPITQPYAQPYSVGGSGSPTTLGPGGSVLTANGGPAGTAPGATFTYPSRSFITGVNYGSSPAEGALIIFENSGT